MLQALSAFRKSLSLYYYELWILALANLIWVVLALFILPIPPATAALYYLAHQVAHEEPISLRLFVDGLRLFFLRSYLLAATIFGISLLLVANILFYSSAPTDLLRIIGFIWVYAAIAWIMVLFYVFPLLIEQQNKGILIILRNAALLVVDNLGFTLTMAVCLALTLVVSLIIPLFFLVTTMAFTAVYQCRALMTLLEKYRDR
jgi:uncharacterized membrane protein YesL